MLGSAAALALGVLAVAGPASSSPTEQDPHAADLAPQAEPAAAGAATIRVAVGANGRGTFLADGAISDAGPAHVTRTRDGSRLTMIQILTGDRGSLVLRVVQRCGRATSAWSVVRGSGAYAGAAGGGKGSGAAPCATPRKAMRAVYRGSVRFAAPGPIAAPGLYGGWTAQKERITFEVLAGGRLVSGIRIERLFASCTPPLEVVLEPAFLAAYPISPDGSFSVAAGSTTVSGRFGQAGAAGSVAYGPVGSGSATCSSGSVGWTAGSPPPPLPVAVPGTYCGSTAQGLGICLTLTPSGHVTRVRVELGVECTQPEQARFDAVVGFGGAVPVRSNLRFDVSGSVDEGASGEYDLRGTFDTAGGATGTLSAYRLTVDVEGTIFTCRNVAVGWTVKRLG